jgi:hypothetical protein
MVNTNLILTNKRGPHSRHIREAAVATLLTVTRNGPRVEQNGKVPLFETVSDK